MILNKILVLSLFATLVLANHITWLGNYNKALRKAKKENKILMVLLIKNNCKACKDIVKNQFTNKSYIDNLNKKVVAIIVNMDSKQDYPREMYGSTKFPKLFFVNSKNEIFIDNYLDYFTKE